MRGHVLDDGAPLAIPTTSVSMPPARTARGRATAAARTAVARATAATQEVAPTGNNNDVSQGVLMTRITRLLENSLNHLYAHVGSEFDKLSETIDRLQLSMGTVKRDTAGLKDLVLDIRNEVEGVDHSSVPDYDDDIAEIIPTVTEIRDALPVNPEDEGQVDEENEDTIRQTGHYVAFDYLDGTIKNSLALASQGRLASLSPVADRILQMDQKLQAQSLACVASAARSLIVDTKCSCVMFT